MAILWAALLLQTDEPKLESKDQMKRELMAAWAKKFEKTTQWTGRGSLQRSSSYGQGSANGTFELHVAREAIDETHPAAVIWTTQERDDLNRNVPTVTRVHRESCTVAYPAEKVAFVYDLSNSANIPWAYFFFFGMTAELEAHFEITVLRRPSDTKPSTNDPPKPTAGHLTGTGAGVYTENLWEIDLAPRHARLREEVEVLTVFLAPDTLALRAVTVKTPSERVELSLSEFAPPETPLAATLFDLPLENYKIKKR
jgi:hypothetical protein